MAICAGEAPTLTVARVVVTGDLQVQLTARAFADS
jgi:hypothetical protein